jgi:hypothetical protein
MTAAQDDLIHRVTLELQRSEDERLVNLGKQSTPQGIGSDADDFDDEHYKRVGQSLLARILERARRQICESQEIRSAVSQLSKNNKVALIPPVADVLITLVSGPALFTATASIISLGLPTYCERYWHREGRER